MTLAEMATLVTVTKMVLLDSTNLAACKEFLRRRYDVIWNAFLWRDAQITATVNTVSGTAEIAMPANMDRVIAIRAASTFLDPVDSALLIEINPTIFEQSGTPTVYEEWTDAAAANAKKIRLLPVPNAVIALRIIGKRTFVPLAADGDSPIIRNIDNCLMAFAHADMLQKLHQYGKAKLLIEEGGALLEAAKQIETEQAAKPRHAKNLTVSTNSLTELTDAVCARTGAWGLDAVVLIKDSIQRRYRQLYDSFFWRDSQMTASVTLTGGTSTTARPANMNRVAAVRAGTDNFLDPIDVTLLIQTDPTIFERSGVPTVYEEITDPTDNSKKIKVYPTPIVNTALFIVGKRTLPDLSLAADVPILRNIENALITFVVGDVLEWQGKSDVATAKWAEANVLLDAAKKIETEQSNQPRRTKRITVAGNSLSEMVDAVCARCGTWALEQAILIRDFLRRNYQMLWDAELWPESMVLANVSSDGEQIVLPEYFDRVIAIRPTPDATYELTPVDIGLYLQIYPQIFEETAAAIGYSTLTPVGVHTLPPTNEKLTFVSTDASDKTNIFVRGESLGLEKSETVTLNGTTNVDSVNTYDAPLTVAKGITVGTVHVTGKVSGTALQALLPTERERKHMRLWLQPSPGTAETALVIGKRRITALASDEDTPMLRNAANVLISGAVADMFEHLGKPKEAENARNKAMAAMKVLKDGELRQNARQPRVIPSVDYSYAYEESWLTKG